MERPVSELRQYSLHKQNSDTNWSFTKDCLWGSSIHCAVPENIYTVAWTLSPLQKFQFSIILSFEIVLLKPPHPLGNFLTFLKVGIMDIFWNCTIIIYSSPMHTYPLIIDSKFDADSFLRRLFWSPNVYQ